MKQLLLSVSIHDCRVDTFRPSGHGGQGMQKRDSAVRVTHEPSGAVAECSETREQFKNKRIAFIKLVNSPLFQKWVKFQASSEFDLQAEANYLESLFKGQRKIEVGV